MSSEISTTALPESGRFKVSTWARILGEDEKTVRDRIRELQIPAYGTSWKLATILAQDYWKHLPALTKVE